MVHAHRTTDDFSVFRDADALRNALWNCHSKVEP
jgi:hypothetical protein